MEFKGKGKENTKRALTERLRLVVRKRENKDIVIFTLKEVQLFDRIVLNNTIRLALELDEYDLFHNFFSAHVDNPHLFQSIVPDPEFDGDFFWDGNNSSYEIRNGPLAFNSSNWDYRAAFVLQQYGLVFCEELYRVLALGYEGVTRKKFREEKNSKTTKKNQLHDLCFYIIRPFLFPI